MGSIPGQGTEIPHAAGGGQINQKQTEQQNTVVHQRSLSRKGKRYITEWETMFANHRSDKGLVCRTGEELQLNRRQPNLEVGKGLEQTLLQRRYTNDQKSTWKDAQHLLVIKDTQIKTRMSCHKQGMATHSSILAWRIPWTEEPVESSVDYGYSPQGHKELDMSEQLTYTSHPLPQL